MNTAGNLRHGKAHRMKAACLRLAMAKSELWRISVSQQTYASSQFLDFTFPYGAQVEETRDDFSGNVIFMVKTQPGRPMRIEQSLPRGVTALRVK